MKIDLLKSWGRKGGSNADEKKRWRKRRRSSLDEWSQVVAEEATSGENQLF